MRILQVHARYRQRGGEDTVVAAEADLLRRAGHEVALFEAANPSSPRAASSLSAAPWNPAAARRLRAAVTDFRPDVAHVHNTWFALSPAVFPTLRGAGVPVVLTLHNYRLLCANAQLFRDGRPCQDCVGSHPWHGVAHACYRDSRLQSLPAAATIALNRKRRTWDKHVDVFIALTEFGREMFVTGGLPPERIVVKPHSVADPGVRRQSPAASREVLVVGRLSPEKGVAQVIEAFQDRPAPSLRLVVIGDGPQRGELETMADSTVEFTGSLPADAVRSRMLQARALVFPSRWYETFGLAMVEAMAAGLPVVASRLGGANDILGTDGGWTVPADDRGAWKKEFSHLDRGPKADKLVDTMGQSARARWQQRYSPAVVTPLLEEIYLNAAGAEPFAEITTGRKSE